MQRVRGSLPSDSGDVERTLKLIFLKYHFFTTSHLLHLLLLMTTTWDDELLSLIMCVLNAQFIFAWDRQRTLKAFSHARQKSKVNWNVTGDDTILLFFFAISHKFGLPSWKIVILSEVISASELQPLCLLVFSLSKAWKVIFSRSDGGEWFNEGLVHSCSRCAF